MLTLGLLVGQVDMGQLAQAGESPQRDSVFSLQVVLTSSVVSAIVTFLGNFFLERHKSKLQDEQEARGRARESIRALKTAVKGSYTTMYRATDVPMGDRLKEASDDLDEAYGEAQDVLSEATDKAVLDLKNSVKDALLVTPVPPRVADQLARD